MSIARAAEEDNKIVLITWPIRAAHVRLHRLASFVGVVGEEHDGRCTTVITDNNNN